MRDYVPEVAEVGRAPRIDAEPSVPAPRGTRRRSAAGVVIGAAVGVVAIYAPEAPAEAIGAVLSYLAALVGL